MLVFTMKNISPSVPDDEVKTHVPSHSGPETDRGEATKAKPRMRRDMALDGFSGASSHTETDRGDATKAEPGMRRAMASDGSSGAPSRPETDRGDATKAEPGMRRAAMTVFR